MDLGGFLLTIIGLLALLCGACEILARVFRGGAIPPTGRRAAARERMYGVPTADETPCPWPEAEVDRLRRMGAL